MCFVVSAVPEIHSGAQFCAKCGAKVIYGQETGPQRSGASNIANTLTGMAKSVNGGTLQLAEGILSVLLALMSLFAPVVKVLYDTGYDAESMLHVALNLSRFRFPEKYAPIGPVLVILMILACVGSLVNAKQAFSNELPAQKEVVGGVRLSSSFASVVTVYALMLVILLGIAGGNAYGIAGYTGWVWFLLFVGVACQAIHFVRWSLNAPRVG